MEISGYNKFPTSKVVENVTENLSVSVNKKGAIRHTQKIWKELICKERIWFSGKSFLCRSVERPSNIKLNGVAAEHQVVAANFLQLYKVRIVVVNWLYT